MCVNWILKIYCNLIRTGEAEREKNIKLEKIIKDIERKIYNLEKEDK